VRLPQRQTLALEYLESLGHAAREEVAGRANGALSGSLIPAVQPVAVSVTFGVVRAIKRMPWSPWRSRRGTAVSMSTGWAAARPITPA